MPWIQKRACLDQVPLLDSLGRYDRCREHERQAREASAVCSGGDCRQRPRLWLVVGRNDKVWTPFRLQPLSLLFF